MKYILIIIFVIFISCGCVNPEEYIPVEEYNSKVLELEEANNIIDDKNIEILELKEAESYISSRDTDIIELRKEIRQYRDLIGNLNELLKNIYYGYASNDKWILDGFTAFSIEYKDRFYLITAGHCVEQDRIKYFNHKFKANFSSEWIYPKLLAYGNHWKDNWWADYAIFESEKINTGIPVDEDKTYDAYLYILGNTEIGINILKRNGIKFPGESGSPVINKSGKVVGILANEMGYTLIEVVLEAIDNLE